VYKPEATNLTAHLDGGARGNVPVLADYHCSVCRLSRDRRELDHGVASVPLALWPKQHPSRNRHTVPSNLAATVRPESSNNEALIALDNNLPTTRELACPDPTARNGAETTFFLQSVRLGPVQENKSEYLENMTFLVGPAVCTLSEAQFLEH
jgi:hypothetical protein